MNPGESAEVVVLWGASETPCAWRDSASTPVPGLRLVAVAPDFLGDLAAAALESGPVVAVVDYEADVVRALALGVDEVLAADDVSAAALATAAARARSRAFARRRTALAGPEDEWRSVDLFAGALNAQVVTPLAVATLNADVVRVAIRAVTSLVDAYARDLRDRAGQDEAARRALAHVAAMPPSAELNATIDDLASSLRESLDAVAQVHALVSPRTAGEPCDLFDEVAEFARFAGALVGRFADLRVDLPRERRHTSMPRARLLHILSAVVGEALRAVRDAARDRGGRGAIAIRAHVGPNAAILDVTDDGTALSPAARAFALDPVTTLRSGTDAGWWIRLAERARRAGGDLRLDARGSGGKTVKLVIPLLPSPAAG